jgi:prevent-host-death family protein
LNALANDGGGEIMLTVNIHEAKTHLSRLIEAAAKGESFIIAKAGKPLVKVVALDAPESSQVRRLGFMADEIDVPEEFDRMGKAEIEKLFAPGE